MTKEPLRFKEAFTEGWQVVNKQFGYFFLLILALTAVQLVETGIEKLLAASGWGYADLMGYALGFVVQMVMTLAFIAACVGVVAGQQPKARDLWKPGQALEFVIASALALIITALGLLFLVVPGLVAMSRLSQIQFLILEQDLSAVEALKASYALTDGYTVPLLGFIILQVLAVTAGLLAFGVGVVIAFPVCCVASVSVYRQLTAQAV